MKKLDKKKIGVVIKEWLDAIIIAAIVVTFLRTFFFQMYKIPTTSMVPTLKPSDKIFVSRVVYGPRIPFTNVRIPGLREPQMGEVVVFIPPHDRHKAYIKRLIGKGGDHVLIKEGNVYLNGKEVVDPRIGRNYYYNQGPYAQERQEIVVPEGKYFFLGDNSISSADSRFWGFVDKIDIIGKALFIWWPPHRVRMVE